MSVRSAPRLPTVLCFDVEDIIAPESDDAVLWMAEILTSHGLPGSFMIVGEKARLWERRGRRDVIEALKNHHLGFHSTWHSVHPTTTEICLQRDYLDGIHALWEWDRSGWEDTERIMGRPLLGWGRTGSSWSPSVMGLMARLGRAYAYSLVRLPGHDVCWYAGCLSFYGSGLGGLDDAYGDDSVFEQRFARARQDIDAFLSERRRGAQWLCFFMGHPTRVIHSAFWDAVNFAKGANPPREAWRSAPRLDDTLIPSMQRNYRRVCEYLQSDPRLEIIGWGDLIRRYDGQKPFATRAELIETARRISDERQVLFTDHFTAGELVLMLGRALTTSQDRYARPDVWGPLSMPSPSPVIEFDARDITDAVPSVEAAVTQTGCLPAQIEVAGQAVGIGTFFVALAEALLGCERVSGPADAPYPEAADAVAREVAQSVPGWVIHPDDMDLTNLLEQTRLQCWALKPAWPRDALGV